jgi:hypothetical protein
MEAGLVQSLRLFQFARNDLKEAVTQRYNVVLGWGFHFDHLATVADAVHRFRADVKLDNAALIIVVKR